MPTRAFAGRSLRVRPVHLSRLSLRGAELADIVRLHAEWALGLGRFASLRAARLSAGIPEALLPEDVEGDRLKIAFRDGTGGTSTSLVRIDAQAGAIRVEHLLLRDEAGRRRGPVVPAAPEIVEHLLSDPRVEPSALRPLATTVEASAVSQLVEHALDPRRREPMILVSVDNGLHRPLAPSDAVASHLRGMASVWSLATVGASRELKERLIARGFSEKFGCYNGGIRILWPGIEVGDDPYDHLLLLPLRLYGVPEAARAGHVAAVFAEMIVEGEDPRAWLRDIEAGQASPDPTPRPAMPRDDRSSAPIRVAAPRPAAVALPERPREATPVAITVTHPPAAPAPEPSTPSVKPVAPEPPPRAEPQPPAPPPSEPQPAAPAPVTAEPHEAPGRPVSTWSKLGDDVLAALDLAAEIERDLDRTRRELVEARRALRRAEQERDELSESEGELRGAAQALAAAAGRFGDALVVLPSATASAERSGYRDPERVFRVLALLAMFGRNDRTLERVLSEALGNAARWKPKDSPQTDKAFGAARTFVASSGHPKHYARHVTLGHGVDATKCLQVYYDVLGDGRIEIAWCGEHRPTVGVDT